MVYVSVALTGLAAVVFAFSARLRGLRRRSSGCSCVMQLQVLFAERDRARRVAVRRRPLAALRARRRGEGPRGSSSRGCDGRAPVRGAAARRSTPHGCAGCSALLPRPLPDGDPWNEYVLTNLLVGAATTREAATLRRRAYGRKPQPMLAATIARAAGALGDEDTAVAWLRAAADGAHGARHGLATVIDQAPELAAVRPAPTSSPCARPPAAGDPPVWARSVVWARSSRIPRRSAPDQSAALDVAEGAGAGDARQHADLGAVDRRSGRRARRRRRRRGRAAGAARTAPRESIRSTSSWPG